MALQLNVMLTLPDRQPILVAQSVLIARAQAHDAFDPLWRDAIHLPCHEAVMRGRGPAARKARCRIANSARRRAYAWLAEQMGLDRDEAHIRFFNQWQCQRVIDLCHSMTAAALRDWAIARRCR
jgi:hypothetical protein